MSTYPKNFVMALVLPKDAENHVHSVKQTIFGIPWILKIDMSLDKPEVDIVCHEDPLEVLEGTWCVYAAVEFFLVLGGERVSIGPKETQEFGTYNNYVYNQLPDTLTESLRSHLEHEEVRLESEVEISKCVGTKSCSLVDFSPKPGWTTLCIKVDDKEFHVNERTLCRSSPKLAIFIAENKDFAVLTIDDTTPEAFEIFLQLAHRRHPHLQENDIEDLMKLEDRFEIGRVREACQLSLMDSPEEKLKELMEIADRFDFEELRSYLINQNVTSIKHLETFKDTWSSLSPKTQDALFARMLELDQERRNAHFSIKSLRGVVYTVTLWNNDSVESLVQKAASIERNPVGLQRLKYHGELLDGSKRLSQYNIHGTIESVLAD